MAAIKGLDVTLASLTALMSRVGKANPDLVQSREVALFIQACIEEAKRLPVERPPLAPVDMMDV
jgi:hypothetical protein